VSCKFPIAENELAKRTERKRNTESRRRRRTRAITGCLRQRLAVNRAAPHAGYRQGGQRHQTDKQTDGQATMHTHTHTHTERERSRTSAVLVHELVVRVASHRHRFLSIRDQDESSVVVVFPSQSDNSARSAAPLLRRFGAFRRTLRWNERKGKKKRFL